MSRYEVHLAFELPFWLALPNGPIDVADGGRMHHFSLSNTVSRLDVGDYYLGEGNLGRTWIEHDAAEALRVKLQQDNPTMPITRHDAKTVLTYVQELDCANDDEVNVAIRSSGDDWHADAIRLTNRIIDAYVVLAPEAQGQIGPVAEWDLGRTIVSVWLVPSAGGPLRQVGGKQLFLRDESPCPSPLDPQLENVVRIALRDEVPFRSLT